MELPAQELMAVGVWNGEPFTRGDLERIAQAFDSLGLSGRVPLKLGHDGPDVREQPETQFALGWVKRVWLEGQRLLADFDVPQKVAHWIREGMLRFVSVELLRDVKAGTRSIPWVLDAVALLGRDQPAVGILAPLAAMSRSPNAALQFSRRQCFSRAGAVILNDASGGTQTKMTTTVNYARKSHETEREWEERVKYEMRADTNAANPNDDANKLLMSAREAAKVSVETTTSGTRKSPDQVILERIQEEFRRNPDLGKAWQLAPGSDRDRH